MALTFDDDALFCVLTGLDKFVSECQCGCGSSAANVHQGSITKVLNAPRTDCERDLHGSLAADRIMCHSSTQFQDVLGSGIFGRSVS